MISHLIDQLGTRYDDPSSGMPTKERSFGDGSQIICHGRQYGNGHSKAGAWSCFFRAWRTEDVGVVWRSRLLRNDIPALFAFLAIAAEFFGGLGLIVGFLTRIAAFGIAVNMLVAIAMVHSSVGLFMNWSGTQKGEGFEYHLLVLAMTAFLIIRGAGAYSIDRAIQMASPSRAAQPGLAH
jgi:uncharacterized membrane protein YphA (DoxX/SURF4 family)